MPALLAAERYHIAVDLTDLPAGPQVRCVSTVTFSCREPGAETFIDCAAQVVSATLNGRTLPAATDGRITLPGLAEHNSREVESVQADTIHDAMQNARIWRGAYDQRQNMITAHSGGYRTSSAMQCKLRRVTGEMVAPRRRSLNTRVIRVTPVFWRHAAGWC